MKAPGFAKRRRRLSESVHESSSSRLLTLPREIRDMIFMVVVAGMEINLDIKNRRIAALVECGSGSSLFPRLSRPRVMGALLTSKQTYLETIQLLHTMNKFQTLSVDIVSFLPRMMLPQRLQQIRYFSFCWRLNIPPTLPPWSYSSRAPRTRERFANNDYRKSWFAAWKTLSLMEGLEHLRVELFVHGRAGTWGWEPKHVEIAKCVTKAKNFLLVVPEDLAIGTREIIQAPNLTIRGLVEDQQDRGFPVIPLENHSSLATLLGHCND
ncbi:hypothetical protein BJ875DRAFT_485893 [Amylocarpus encephaloides]|uniref:DUF7730 domain-containing protein n=1 Tax=Amylocarpus encephaloides TaxID=45428 RepID=A0A9P7YFD9_9HELO|nr:hypothetical protein BJ875DRAFT_485893 [Amylocarpus encephaloides]